jgi:hypothetical protein
MNFADIMKKGFEKERERTKIERLTYDGHKVKVGASTVSGCAKMAAYPILFGEEPPTLEEDLRMRKGNIAELIVEGNLTEMGIKYERQGEYNGTGEFDFILVHPDILIDVNDPGENLDPDAEEFIQRSKDKGCDYILYELKTTNAIPAEPHDYWIRQTNMQAQYIADSKGIDPEKIDIFVYAMELNDGRNKEFDLDFEVEEVLLAQDDAISFVSVIEDFIQYANKEKDTMDFTINDVHRRVGNLCSICKFANSCLGSGEVVEFPPDLQRSISTIKEWAKQEKNIKATKEEVKKFMLNLGTKKGKAPGYAVTLKGGNVKEVINPDSFSDEEKLALMKRDASFVSVNVKQLAKFYGTKNEEDLWITDEKHMMPKTSAISVMITEVKQAKE